MQITQIKRIVGGQRGTGRDSWRRSRGRESGGRNEERRKKKVDRDVKDRNGGWTNENKMRKASQSSDI